MTKQEFSDKVEVKVENDVGYRKRITVSFNARATSFVDKEALYDNYNILDRAKESTIEELWYYLFGQRKHQFYKDLACLS